MRVSYFLACTGALTLSACGGAMPPPQASPPVASVGAIAISEPRVRLPASGQTQTAAYMTLTNSGIQPERLIAASSTGAGKVELHAHIKTVDGMMAMRKVSHIDVPAKASVALSPGGYHIMLTQLRPALKLGGALVVQLDFASGSTVQFTVPVVTNPSVASDKKGVEAQSHQH